MGKIQPFKAATDLVKNTISPVTNIVSGKGTLGDLINIGTMAYGGGGGDFFKRFGTDTFLKNAANPFKIDFKNDPMGSLQRIQGLMGAAGGGMAGAGANVGINPNGTGGFQGFPPGTPMSPALMALFNQANDIAQGSVRNIMDATGTIGQVENELMYRANQASEGQGAQYAQRVGIPTEWGQAQVGLHNQNQAREDANRFIVQRMGPMGQAEAASAALASLRQPYDMAMGIGQYGLSAQSLANQRYNTDKQFQKGTFGENVFGSILGSVPQLAANWGSLFGPKKSTGSGGSGGGSGGLSTPYTGFGSQSSGSGGLYRPYGGFGG